MKRIFLLAVLAAVLLVPAAEARQPGAWNHWGYSGRKPGFICIIPPPPARDQVSDTTLILSLDPAMKEEALTAICQKYHLQLLYDYKNFSMAAVAADHPLTETEMGTLITQLSQEPGVLGVERDRIMQLDKEREE